MLKKTFGVLLAFLLSSPVLLAGCGGGGDGSVDGGPAPGQIEQLNDPECDGPLMGSGRAPCGGGKGLCTGSTCCFGCVNGDGKCVGGADPSDCGGSGYDCHVCTGSNYPFCVTADLGTAGTARACSTSTTPPAASEANNADCSSPTKPSCQQVGDYPPAGCVGNLPQCKSASGLAGACIGTTCCMGCIDGDGVCRSELVCSVGGVACSVAANTAGYADVRSCQ